MKYNALLNEANAEGISIKERPFKTYDGRIKGKDIYLRKDMNTAEKSCVLAEELGHYYTTVGDILDMNVSENRKQERQARLWGYNRVIGLFGLIRAYEHGCKDKYEIADYLDVTEEYLEDCINCYRDKYGEYKIVDNYTIYFIPNLMIFKKI
ncbi:ImmA/IrrE family metallo-endopeptidase [Dorea longicatena]|uniref:ImmA/IrrE family metallo-endopeptidase n=2 Tax=Dorea longicatena TaxID=88431 RepID=UPI001570E616|nr:ImmA/IrrE family metallo-endopeptidase [Dorea longicatena]NSC51494.1 ImmA/IrrE family metallo-endopeptidase [Dorea longicatena]NSD27639.1 ImmA/IrrE family metallo-endopeptidase [Dorea longicatena]NSD72216.1 ImmA/IrrE family metallo-endopeptidase [Dorea longicatena]NSD75171.1 ImmA/IrrE family metallo-endopeptidase [Dorea longicatena]